MNESVLDVLLYLFENYMEGDIKDGASRASLQTDLEDAGFDRSQVNNAFRWLEELASRRHDANLQSPTEDSVRVYTDAETARMSSNCRGFLLHLERLGVLSPKVREMVIERAMALESEDDIDAEQVKWVVLMVLFNQPGEEAAYAWVEELIFGAPAESLH